MRSELKEKSESRPEGLHERSILNSAQRVVIDFKREFEPLFDKAQQVWMAVLSGVYLSPKTASGFTSSR